MMSGFDAVWITTSPVLKAFLAGSISGTCSTVLFQPLDLVKTRLQSTKHVATLARPRIASTIGMMETFNSIIQKEHLFALWKGMIPSLTRCVPGVGLYFGSMHWMKSKFTDGRPTATQAMMIGIVARSISGICLIPITVVKTRVESGEYKYHGVVDALRHIYRAEGVRGLSCGLLPTLFRDAPFSGLYLVFYSQIKQTLPKEVLTGEMAAATHFTVGLLAGALASLVTQPADVIKTKMQLDPQQYKSIPNVVVLVYQKYGVCGYFKGLIPRMLRRTLIAAMAWTIYEQLTQSIGLK
ncbi:mitochondrial glycine transporter-like isoform X2 [Macrosteles quadrilineatus]|uniref:mitochondrial glycine transporter-like isoform X2 n=1 Tax=Macrosteles quadrilineatus TaxID=74068 RepID=UPI0023E0D507|nr:mitochondrial glycine transporter-like isoform X2 [Macrosteles quadrilineatus]XP_054284871.1 mitochondrial glycine transporter-like isoform X2 [Macrosteles quadrilineatus]